MPDKTIKCRDCGNDFEFTESEQSFYKEKGFENEPQRCPGCRAAKKGKSKGNKYGYGRSDREMFPAICAECGKKTTVPFRPSADKPIYCKDCYQTRGR